jgi:nucleotide-binding universal stress UspA family protein
MNARGAMELVVATIGLGLGILNQQMFSVIVMVAIVTSFMAPVGLRITMRRVRVTDEEARRMLAEQTRGAFDPARVKVLVPTAGGPNAVGAAQLAMGIAKRSETPPEIVFIDAKVPWWRGLFGLSRRDETRPGANIEEHFATIASMKGTGRAPRMRRAVGTDVPALIVEEAKKGYDLVLLGASQREPIFRGGGPTPVGGRIIEAVVHRAPCHVAIVRGATSTQTFQHLLVPIDGRAVTRLAAELALRYAEAVGARLTLATLAERRPSRTVHDPGDSGSYSVPPPGPTPDEELERISAAFSASEVKPEMVRLPESRSSSAIAGELASGKYDLVVLGTENRAIQHRLYFGYENEKLIRESNVPVLVLVPNVRRLG